MRDLNRVILLGNLASDPTLKTSEAGNNLCYFDLAVGNNAKEKEKQRTNFIRILVLGKFAEVCAQYLKKGRRTLVEGKINSYIREKDDGTNVKYTEVLADEVHFLDKPKTEEPKI